MITKLIFSLHGEGTGARTGRFYLFIYLFFILFLFLFFFTVVLVHTLVYYTKGIFDLRGRGRGRILN